MRGPVITLSHGVSVPEAMFDRWADAVRQQHHFGTPLPDWKDMTELQQNYWRQITRTVVDQVIADRAAIARHYMKPEELSAQLSDAIAFVGEHLGLRQET